MECSGNMPQMAVLVAIKQYGLKAVIVSTFGIQ